MGTIVTNGLVGCWDMASTKSYPGSGTTWTDLSKEGNNGTLTNGPTPRTSHGGSIEFDGTDDFISVPHSSSLDITAELTIDTWVYFNGEGTRNHVIVAKENTANMQYALLLRP